MIFKPHTAIFYSQQNTENWTFKIRNPDDGWEQMSFRQQDIWQQDNPKQHTTSITTAWMCSRRVQYWPPWNPNLPPTDAFGASCNTKHDKNDPGLLGSENPTSDMNEYFVWSPCAGLSSLLLSHFLLTFEGEEMTFPCFIQEGGLFLSNK